MVRAERRAHVPRLALGDLVSEEIRGWLDRVPHAILRLATLRLDTADRETTYREVWGPDLDYFLRGDESRPITRLIRGMKFAVSLAWRVRSGDAPPPDPVAGETNLTATGTLSGTSVTISGATGDMRAGVGEIEVTAEAGVAVAAGTAGQPTVKVYERRDARPNKRKPIPKKGRKRSRSGRSAGTGPGVAAASTQGRCAPANAGFPWTAALQEDGMRRRASPSGGFSGPEGKAEAPIRNLNLDLARSLAT